MLSEMTPNCPRARTQMEMKTEMEIRRKMRRLMVQACAFPAVSSFKVFLIIEFGKTSLPVMSFIGKEPDNVGPSIIAGIVFCVFIPTLKLPPVSELVTLPISNLIPVPAGTLTGLLTVYINVLLDGAANEPEPMPLLSISLVAAETSKPDGKDI